MEQEQIEKRAQRAAELFKAGYNCSQSVLLAYAEYLHLDTAAAATMAAPFGGGLGRQREVCGAVSGAAMVIGHAYPYCEPSDRARKKQLYELVQRHSSAFRSECGSIICRELLGVAKEPIVSTPEERTDSYYKKRPCAQLVELSARLVGELLP